MAREDRAYRQELKESGLPEKVKLPSKLIRELEQEDRDTQEDLLSGYLFDNYGTHNHAVKFLDGTLDSLIW